MKGNDMTPKTQGIQKLLTLSLMGMALAQAGIAGAAERESGGRLAPTAVRVQFTSPGNGIDQKTQDKVLKIANREVKSGELLKLTVSNLGREGERDLCLQFDDFSKAFQIEQEIAAIVEKGN